VERLRSSGSQNARQLVDRLPSYTAPARWPWMDLVDIIEGKRETADALVGVGGEEPNA
jgi:hypothetical protein